MTKNQDKIEVIDLFCGAGGLSLGFNDFNLVGFDNNSELEEVFKKNISGNFHCCDLSSDNLKISSDIIIGGPPCKPWSIINVNKKGKNHPDYKLIKHFFRHVFNILPDAFLLENVPPLSSDPIFTGLINRARNLDYSISWSIIKYSDYGAATKRRRLITVGFRNNINPKLFFKKLKKIKKRPKTVGEAIKKYENIKKGFFPDHDWPEFKTINKYKKYYETGKFGWYQLDYSKQAPSFGNITKTYILHPMAGYNGFPLRVISIREAMEIMGFPQSFKFPKDFNLCSRYQMVADAVSPVVSKKFSEVFKELI